MEWNCVPSSNTRNETVCFCRICRIKLYALANYMKWTVRFLEMLNFVNLRVCTVFIQRIRRMKLCIFGNMLFTEYAEWNCLDLFGCLYQIQGINCVPPPNTRNETVYFCRICRIKLYALANYTKWTVPFLEYAKLCKSKRFALCLFKDYTGWNCAYSWICCSQHMQNETFSSYLGAFAKCVEWNCVPPPNMRNETVCLCCICGMTLCALANCTKGNCALSVFVI
jgi:hypothetical protein